MFRHSLLAACAAAAIAATSTAEVSTLLDIPSGSGTDIDWMSSDGLAPPFAISSEYMNFRLGGFATEGAVRAWDFENDENVRGKIFFTADEGFEFTAFSFDLSGFKEYDSEARFKLKLNGELWKDKTWSFEGNETLIHKDWILPEGVTSLEIVLENLEGNAWHGLDNMEITTVPAPGALALAGLAGLVAAGRRRDL